MSNCNDIKIVMNLVSDGGSTDKFGIPIQQGSLEDINKPFISIKINGSDLHELDVIDLKKAQDEIQKYIDELETENEDWKKVYFDGEIDG